MTDAEAEEIRQRVEDEASPPALLRTCLWQLLDDRDARRDLEKKSK